MKLALLNLAFVIMPTVGNAQNTDQVAMTINGKPVTKGEFEYSYRKNNAQGMPDHKSVAQYVDLFVNYKLKVEEALAQRLDTLSTFRAEYKDLMAQQVRPKMITNDDIERRARQMYDEVKHRVDSTGGMVKVAHILLMMKQTATADEQKTTKQRIDSIYNALKNGASFADMARKYSQDQGTAGNGGELPPIIKGQTFPEFEETAWSLHNGEISIPFTSPAGWHIVKKDAAMPFYDYASQHDDILKYISQTDIKDNIIDEKIYQTAKDQHISTDDVIENKLKELESSDSTLTYLMQEYHDGLLLYDVSNKNVWQKARKDKEGQERFFNKNKKKYKFDSPRFRGIAYETRHEDDIKAVKKAVKKAPFEKWPSILRTTFNADSVKRIKVTVGMFKKGDNVLVDKEIFRTDTTITPDKEYPHHAVYGKKLKKPQSMEDVSEQVIADYQEMKEKEWVEQLRRKYNVEINRQVINSIKE